MKIKSVGVKVDGVMVAAVGVGIVGYLLYTRGRKAVAAVGEAAEEFVTETINPASRENFVNQSIYAAVGEEKTQGFFDKVFAAVDLINPFNKSDAYAKQVWGLDRDEYGFAPYEDPFATQNYIVR